MTLIVSEASGGLENGNESGADGNMIIDAIVVNRSGVHGTLEAGNEQVNTNEPIALNPITLPFTLEISSNEDGPVVLMVDGERTTYELDGYLLEHLQKAMESNALPVGCLESAPDGRVLFCNTPLDLESGTPVRVDTETLECGTSKPSPLPNQIRCFVPPLMRTTNAHPFEPLIVNTRTGCIKKESGESLKRWGATLLN